MNELEELLREQSGVIARRQALALGLADHDLRRLVRGRHWVRLHSGVFVDHTGTPTWQQRGWAGILAVWPAALCHHSALRAVEGPGRRDRDDDVVHVAVDRRRGPRVAPVGVRLHHVVDLSLRTAWNASPPRVRVEHAALDVASEAATDLAAIAVLAGVVQSRQTTAARLRDALELRPRSARRAWLRGALHDIAEGTTSVLEHSWLTRVERPHRLPRPVRQERGVASCGVVYRDAAYDDLLIELDGRLFHDTARRRDADLERDLDAAVDGRRTLRLSWGQVHERPCATAAKVGRVMALLGMGAASPCGPGCAVRATLRAG